MRRNRKRALGLAGILIGSLAACGGSSGDNQVDTGSDSKAEQTTAAPADTAAAGKGEETTAGEGAGEPVTLKFSWWGNQNRHDYTQKILDKYTELHPNVTFEAMPSGWDGYFDKLSTQAASGSMPDIVQMDYLYITTYAKNNSLADMQPYIDNGTIDVSGMSEAVLNTGRIDDKLAGIVGSTGTLAVGYNPAVFEEAGPVVTGDAGMINENNNYASKMSSRNSELMITTPPVNPANTKAMWNKPGFFLCISETSKVKDEAAAFINWFLNSEESNDIMMAERGVPSMANARDFLVNSGKMDEKQKEMFAYADTVLEFSGEAPAPDPIGIAEVGESFKNCAYKAFYGQISTEEAAADFRKEADEILARNN